MERHPNHQVSPNQGEMSRQSLSIREIGPSYVIATTTK
jgi:hypothetical protein